MWGIDQLNFYTSAYYLDLTNLAERQRIPVEDFYENLGQKQMAIIPPNEDIVTLGANAAYPLLEGGAIREQIGLVIFATESATDMSKAASSYIHSFFQLPHNCRIIELKQACYAATFGLFTGLEWLKQHKDKKVLLIASDIAKYPLNSKAEASQGGGAVAMLLSQNPHLLEIQPFTGVYTKEILDFWHPQFLSYALVDGRLSCESYLRVLAGAWCDYQRNTGLKWEDHQAFCFHNPVTKLVKKGYQYLLKLNKVGRDDFPSKVAPSLIYSQKIGNCYTASLFLGLLSLLVNKSGLQNNLIGLYSYGSGSTGEFFAARVMESYFKQVRDLDHRLIQRIKLTYSEYLEINSLNERLFHGNFSGIIPPNWQSDRYYLQAIDQNKRIYGSR